MAIAIINARVLAPELLYEKGAIEFDGGKIVYIGENLRDCFTGEIIDGEGHTVLPGLIDTHIHMTMDAVANQALHYSDSDATIALKAARNATATLRAGFTTVRDMGAKNHVDIAVRNAIAAGMILGPRMLVSGKPICMTGGHGWVFGREADGPDETRKAAREQLKAGADIIKIMATGGVLTAGVDPGA
ncbi:MAG: amidohydrolase family protein, partial [bacterium]|nr:amidohydrolase family protein [bacterium]